MQITLLLGPGLGTLAPTGSEGGLACGGHTPHVESHHLMPGFIAASFNYHQTRRVELGSVTMLTMSPVIA